MSMLPSQLIRLFVWLCPVVLAASAVAQAPGAAPKQAPPSSTAQGTTQGSAQNKPESGVLRVTTRLVQVNVVVQDKKGQPVSDLTREDFTVLDQGQQQTISTFSVESSHILPAPAEPQPSNLFSNRYEQKGGAPTAVSVILLDGLNTKFEDMAYARQQIIKFLGQLRPQDRVALYTLTNGLRVLHDFTSDATPLLQALERYKGHTTHQLAASEAEVAVPTGNDAIDDFLNAANRRMADFYTVDRVKRTAGALEAIANHLARLPGRKNLIWVSGSFPFSINLDLEMTPANASVERRTFSEEVERAARALNNANLAVYPVDARGLMTQAAFNRNFSAATSSGRYNPRRSASLGALHPPHENFDTMNILADRTGGRAFYNTNDIQGAIRRAIEDSQVTYVLGYYPAHGTWDGKFRELKVQVKRPGLHVRHRRGYFALPDVQVDQKQRDRILREAANSPLDDTGVGLNVRADVVDVPGARTLKTNIQIDSRDVSLQRENDRWNGALDVLLIQRGADGKDVASELKTFTMHLTASTHEEIMKKGLTLTRNLPIQPGAAQLRIVVRDTETGSIGSLTIPLSKLFASGN